MTTDEICAGDLIVSAGRKYRVYYSCTACEWCATDQDNGETLPLRFIKEFSILLRHKQERDQWEAEAERFKDIENMPKRYSGRRLNEDATPMEKLRLIQRRGLPLFIRQKIAALIHKYLAQGLSEDEFKWVDSVYFFNSEPQ